MHHTIAHSDYLPPWDFWMFGASFLGNPVAGFPNNLNKSHKGQIEEAVIVEVNSRFLLTNVNRFDRMIKHVFESHIIFMPRHVSSSLRQVLLRGSSGSNWRGCSGPQFVPAIRPDRPASGKMRVLAYDLARTQSIRPHRYLAENRREAPTRKVIVAERGFCDRIQRSLSLGAELEASYPLVNCIGKGVLGHIPCFPGH